MSFRCPGSNADKPSRGPESDKDEEDARLDTAQSVADEPDELSDMGRGVVMTLPLWALAGIVAWLWWTGWF